MSEAPDPRLVMPDFDFNDISRASLGAARRAGGLNTFALVARAFVGRSWPTYGEGKRAADRFKAAFVSAAEASGWKVYFGARP